MTSKPIMKRQQKCQHIEERPQQVGKIALVPKFLVKLYTMVSDPSTDSIVCWNAASNDDSSFIIKDQT